MLEETVHQPDVTHAVTGSGEFAPQPTPRPDQALLDAYSEWLFFERRLLCKEMYPGKKHAEDLIPHNTGASDFHFPVDRKWNEEPQPSTRAAHVLDAVGCDWINRGRRQPTTRDPVFELIAAERATYSALQRVWDEWDAVEGEPLPDKKRREAEASRVSADARDAVYAAQPTTSAGLLAMLQLFYERNIVGNTDDVGSDTQAMFARVRTFLSRQMPDGRKAARPVTARPDPIEVLWRQRYDACRKLEAEPVTPNDDDDDSPSSILLRQVWNAEDLIFDAAPSLTQAAASALIRLAATMNGQDKIADVDPKDDSTDWAAVNTLKALRPYLTGLLAETVADVLDHPDRPLWDSELCHRDRFEPEQSSTLQAAE